MMLIIDNTIMKFLVEAPIRDLVIIIPTNDKNIARVITCIGFLAISFISSFGYRMLALDRPIIINSTVNIAKNMNKFFIGPIKAYNREITLIIIRAIIVFDTFSMIFIPPT